MSEQVVWIARSTFGYLKAFTTEPHLIGDDAYDANWVVDDDRESFGLPEDFPVNVSDGQCKRFLLIEAPE